MRKTLQDVASYLKETMVPETHEAYKIKSAYASISLEENIHEGVLVFRAFLVRLYDVLYDKGNIYDNCKRLPMNMKTAPRFRCIIRFYIM